MYISRRSITPARRTKYSRVLGYCTRENLSSAAARACDAGPALLPKRPSRWRDSHLWENFLCISHRMFACVSSFTTQHRRGPVRPAAPADPRPRKSIFIYIRKLFSKCTFHFFLVSLQVSKLSRTQWSARDSPGCRPLSRAARPRRVPRRRLLCVRSIFNTHTHTSTGPTRSGDVLCVFWFVHV